MEVRVYSKQEERCRDYFRGEKLVEIKLARSSNNTQEEGVLRKTGK